MYASIAARSDFLVRVSLVVIGLVLWVIGSNIHDIHFFGLDVAKTLSELGFVISVMTLFHWIHESRMRKELVQDIVAAATGSEHLAQSGIVDYVPNARKIDYSADLNTAKDVVICVHYSPRFLEDNYQSLARRTGPQNCTTIVALKDNSSSLKYLLETRGEHDHIQPNIRKIRSIVESLKNAGVNVRLIEHDSILRYSFVRADSFLWIKFYKNSLGISEIPAFRVQSGTTLFSFFDRDIAALLKVAV
jgi:hypothetical protein